MSEHQTGPRCRRIPHQKTHTHFQAAILHLLHTHNALGLGLHRRAIYNHYTANYIAISITFIVNFYCIYGWYFTNGFYYIYG